MLTNAHVVGDSRSAVVFFPDIKDGRPEVKRKHYLERVVKLAQPGKVVAVDRKRDARDQAIAEVKSLEASLDAANLFVVPLDDQRHWYRYHRLFTDLLRFRHGKGRETLE